MNNELMNCPWYHGKLTNTDLKKLFKNHGDFLVRNSLHETDQYTLSVFLNSKLHHFRINKLYSEQKQYCEYLFDNKSLRFASVTELVEHYFKNSIEITKQSGCLIKTPILRSNDKIINTNDDDDEKHRARFSNKNNLNDDESSAYYELFTPQQENKQLDNKKSTSIYLNTKTLVGFRNRNILLSASSANDLTDSVADDGEKQSQVKKKSFVSSHGNLLSVVKNDGKILNADSEPLLNIYNPPPKPVRIPTIKCKEKPDYLKNMIKSVEKKDAIVVDDEETDNDYESEYERIKEEKRRKFSYLGPPKLPMPAIPYLNEMSSNDITVPVISNFHTIINLKSYKCDNLIQDQTKRLDRNALSEINRILLYNDNENNEYNSSSLAFDLAKCITYEDLQLLRYNYDFGLGINNGIELLCLLHGNFVRIDLIDRHKTFKLFISVLICLCQISVELRIKLIILWIDCAFYLFEKLKNFYAFSYVMEALNHEKIKRLNETWLQLKEKNEIKFNLLNRLNEHYEKMNRGDYYLIEKEALIPNIYPIALLLCENIDLNVNFKQERKKEASSDNELLIDYNRYKWLIDVFLANNARNYLQNSNDYLKRYEKFLEIHYAPLFSFKYHKNNSYRSSSTSNSQHSILLKLNYLTQSEFHKIILWSNEVRNYIDSVGDYVVKSANMSEDNLALVELNLRLNDINTIISILSSKIQN